MGDTPEQDKQATSEPTELERAATRCFVVLVASTMPELSELVDGRMRGVGCFGAGWYPIGQPFVMRGDGAPLESSSDSIEGDYLLWAWAMSRDTGRMLEDEELDLLVGDEKLTVKPGPGRIGSGFHGVSPEWGDREASLQAREDALTERLEKLASEATANPLRLEVMASSPELLPWGLLDALVCRLIETLELEDISMISGQHLGDVANGAAVKAVKIAQVSPGGDCLLDVLYRSGRRVEVTVRKGEPGSVVHL